METTGCEYCGASLKLLRAGARFCSTKHRVYASRKPRFPVEMTGKDRWVRRTSSKRPITAAGKSASSTDAGTWDSFAAASASTKGAGLGFVLGAGIGCIDLDHCFDGGNLLPWAQAIVDRCPETFMEVSQSGEGLHIFGLLPEGGGRNIRSGDSNVEFYSVGRYMAVTGERFNGSPSKLADLSGVVASVL